MGAGLVRSSIYIFRCLFCHILIYHSIPTVIRPDFLPMHIYLTILSMILADFAGLQYSIDVPTQCTWSHMELQVTALMLQCTIYSGGGTSTIQMLHWLHNATELTTFFLIDASQLGLCTIHCINGLMVAIYSGHHCTIRDLNKFGLYMATA